MRGHGNDGRRTTVRDLLQQTSGLPDYLQNIDLFTASGFQQRRYDTVTARQAVTLATGSKPVLAPGSAWGYSNIPGPHATGYERFPGPGATPEDPRYSAAIRATALNPSWAGVAGGIISTPEDANTFLRALVQGRLLPPPSQLRQMKTTVPMNKDYRQFWPGGRYGLGLMWIPNSCGGSWSHGGDILGFMTRNGVSPDGKRSVVVTMNTDSPVRNAGVPAPQHEMTRTLIDHALCES